MRILKIKHVVFIVLSVFWSTSLFSQDLIVTDEGDSLNCKITKINNDFIYFTFKHNEEIRSTLLATNQVKFKQYNYYQTVIVPADKVIYNGVYPRFRAGLNGGLSYRVAKMADNIPPDFEKYVNDLKSGYHYGADLFYYFSEQIGFGFKYYVYRSKNELDNIYITQPDGTKLYGKMSDNILINFIGPAMSTRLMSENKKNSLLMNLGIGYMGFKNDAVLISDLILKSSTLGLCWDIGYDISLSDKFALGFQISYMIGTLTQYELSSGTKTQTIKLEKDNYESLSRIDLSIGLRLIK